MGSFFRSDCIAIFRLNGEINEKMSLDFQSRCQSILSIKFNVKAVMIQIASQGGTLGAAQGIVEAMKFVRDEMSLKWVSSVTDVATSAAYYIASEADRFVVTESAMLGGAGAKFALWDASDLLASLGIKKKIISANDSKISFGIFDEISKKYIETGSNFCESVTASFLDHLVSKRAIDRDFIKKIQDGCIFDGKTAINNCAADAMGSMLFALRECCIINNLSSIPEVKLFSIGDAKKSQGLIGRFIGYMLHKTGEV